MTPTPINYSAIKAAILKSTNVLITGHVTPEGDCTCACIAVYRMVTHLGKPATLHNQSLIEKRFFFLADAEKFVQTIPDISTFDLCITLDCGDLERTGKIAATIKASGITIINIDHHKTNTAFGAINAVTASASSTGEVVHDIMTTLGIPVDTESAGAIFCAISADTGSFKYSNTTPHTFKIASDLVAAGVNPWLIAERLHETHSREHLKLVGLTLQTLWVSENGRYASVEIPLSFLKQTGASIEECNGLINYPRGIETVEIAIQFRELSDHECKVSFRSKGKYDVAALSETFGGGGHHNAAGCTVPNSLTETKQIVYHAVKSLIQ